MATDTKVNEFRTRCSALDAKHKEEKMELWRANYGPCSNYKGHFDGSSFWFGLGIGAGLTLVAAAILLGHIH